VRPALVERGVDGAVAVRSHLFRAPVALLGAATGCPWSEADEGARAGSAAAHGVPHAEPPKLPKPPPGSPKTLNEFVAAEAIRAAKAMFEIPEPSANGGEIQLKALKGAVKDATCDYLANWVSSGEQPSPGYYFDNLNGRLAKLGGPAQNQADAINASFAKLKTAATGKADAKEAAKKIACAYIPG
jgi:hypothetical protein